MHAQSHKYCTTYTLLLVHFIQFRKFYGRRLLFLSMYILLSSGTRAKKPSSIHAEGGGGGVGDDTVSVSSVMTTQSTDESGTALQALHKAVLEIVYSLSSDVSLKKNSQGLNQ